MKKQIRLTTVDNPYNPFTHWKEWLLYDVNAGYNTNGRLATLTFFHDAMTEEEELEEIENAMNILIKTGAINKKGEIIEYKKVIKEEKTPENTQ